jgi:hypothetical protein
LGKEHNNHIGEGGKWLSDFTYRNLFKWKRRLEDELLCTRCKAHLLKIAGYFKMHTSQYPETIPLCIYLMHNCLTLEGQEAYEDFIEVRAKILDLLGAKRPVPDELNQNPIYLAMKKCRLIVNGKSQLMPARHLPSITAFPDFNLEKESKLYLCKLDRPQEELVSEFKKLVKALLVQKGPKTLDIPSNEGVISLGPQKYSDGHEVKQDFEKPCITWTSSWDYQRFKTDNRTEREVWLPPKGYKMVSSWWHFLLDPIMKRIEWVVHSDQFRDLSLEISERWKPCKKIDLKGFGLQFPREYIVCTMEAILEVYPNETIQEYFESAKRLFSKLEIQMEDKTFFQPDRGVGLGYFSNVMTLGIAALLQEFDIVKMFNDDILCPSENYIPARTKLEKFLFVINEKKSGQEWLSRPFFANITFVPNNKGHFMLYNQAQGIKAAVFNKRYHYERKNIMLMCKWPHRWKANYHYERLFGYEVNRGEAFMHPSMLGLNPDGEYLTGYVKGGLLRKYKAPQSDHDVELNRIWSIQFPWRDPPPRKDFQKIRNSLRKKKNIVYYTEYDDYLNPEVRFTGNIPLKPVLNKGNYQLPSWSDLQEIIAHHRTYGRTLQGHNPIRASERMLDYLLADNPIHAWLAGGYEVITPYYRIPGVNPWIQVLYESIRKIQKASTPIANKSLGEGSLVHMGQGSGISFFNSIKVEEEINFEIIKIDTTDLPDIQGDDDLSDDKIEIEDFNFTNESSEEDGEFSDGEYSETNDEW